MDEPRYVLSVELVIPERDPSSPNAAINRTAAFKSTQLKLKAPTIPRLSWCQFLCNVTKCTTLDCCKDFYPNTFQRSLKNSLSLGIVLHSQDTTFTRHALIGFTEAFVWFKNKDCMNLRDNQLSYSLSCTSFVVCFYSFLLFCTKLFNCCYVFICF